MVHSTSLRAWKKKKKFAPSAWKYTIVQKIIIEDLNLCIRKIVKRKSSLSNVKCIGLLTYDIRYKGTVLKNWLILNYTIIMSKMSNEFISAKNKN